MGPYLAERAWGTVREDYSPDGDAWSYFPWEQAISRAYRWNEDGMGGICDDHQLVCLALALWNGQDPILKERPFGLTNSQGNHGEDVKECWWYLDATPTSSWLQWRYHYPQATFPYEDLVAENGRRGRNDPEYELVDTGIFDDDRYFVVTVTWAKDGPEDLLWQIEVQTSARIRPPSTSCPRSGTATVGAGSSASLVGPPSASRAVPGHRANHGHRLRRDRPRVLAGGPGPDGKPPEPLFCDNDTNTQKLWGTPGPPTRRTAYPTTSSTAGIGQPRPKRHQGCASVPPRTRAGATAQIRLRFADEPLTWATVSTRARPAQARGGRVLRQHRAGRHHRRRSDGVAAGGGRDALVQAVLPLRRPTLVGR